MFTLGNRSKENLHGVHSDLILVVAFAIRSTPLDFAVTEGLRSLERQKKLYDKGASKTLDSQHLTGHAVDLAVYVDGQITWNWPVYDRLAIVMKEAAEDLSVALEWGGDWKSFRDGPHFQLSRSDYA